MKRILISMPSEPTFARDLQLGIALYARSHGPWNFVAPLGHGGGWRFEPGDLDVDGALLPVTDPQTLQPFQQKKIPLVSLTAFPGIPKVTNHNANIGQLAASHFLELGFRHLAFSGHKSAIYSLQRREAFTHAAQIAGIPCHVHEGPSGKREDWSWPNLQKELQKFLKSLPTPCALFASNDARAKQIADAAASLGIVVPEQLAILGVDNDEALCEIANPPLSSIALNGERAGFEAAALLDRLMHGEPPHDQTIQIPPIGLVVRASTDTLAIDDPLVAAALRFIRSRPNRPMTIAHILAEIPLSQRALERRFQQRVGKTLFEEIRRTQIEHVKRLLAETDWPIQDIARASAFKTLKRLGEVFKQTTGQSPTQFRRPHRKS